LTKDNTNRLFLTPGENEFSQKGINTSKLLLLVKWFAGVLLCIRPNILLW